MRFTLIAVVLFLVSCSQSMVKKTDEFMKADKIIAEKAVSRKWDYRKAREEYENKYKKLFSNQKINFTEYDNEMLGKLFIINYIMSFHLMKDEYLKNVEEIFKELEKRKLDREKSLYGRPYPDELFGLYIKFNYFPKAKEIQKKYSDILAEFVPDVIEDKSTIKDKYKLYQVLPDGKTIKLISVDLNKFKMIAYFSIKCPFTKETFDVILSDEKLRNYFAKDAILITPLGTSISEIEDIVKWYNDNKLKWFLLPTNRDFGKEWEDLLEDLPYLNYFYFLKDGKIVDKLHGWGTPDKEKFKLKLYEEIKKIE